LNGQVDANEDFSGANVPVLVLKREKK